MAGIIKTLTGGDICKEKLLNGVEKVAEVVGSTMGYRGRTVLIETQGGKPEYTKDGYDTLQSVFLEDPIEGLAAETIKEASQKTVDEAGDGTSGTVVLANSFVINSHEALIPKQSFLNKWFPYFFPKPQVKTAIDIKSDIEKSKDKVVEYLRSISRPVTDKIIYDVARTSANDDEPIAKIVTEAFLKAGENGSVGHFRSDNDETYLDYIDGTLIESGFSDEGFVNIPTDRTAVFENPLIVLSNITFKTVRQLEPFLNFAISNDRALVIVSEFEPSVHDAILLNVVKHKYKIAVVKPPSIGGKRKDFLSDLALICNTQMISTLSGDDFSGRESAFMGTCSKITIGKTDTILVPSSEPNDNVTGKISELKEIIANSSNNLEKEYLQDRISKLSGGISIIKVGAVTESELKEKIARVDDAVRAVRSAKEQGVVAGGGIALLGASYFVEGLDEVTKYSLRATFARIIVNAGVTDFTLTESQLKSNIGYNVKTFEPIDMFKAGIVDSTKVIIASLTNAVSVANTILMTSNAITYKREL